MHDIYETIIKNQLYDFNTDVPEHVLRTTIRRHTKGVERVDSSEEELFEMNESEMYGVIGMEKRPITKSAAKGIKRIHRASDKDEIIQNLLNEKVGVFKEIWKLLLFSANIGYANQRREKLKSIETGKGIDQSTFGNSPSWPGILYLINLVETGTSDSLSGSANAEDERLLVFQEYA
ncbi:MAG TPA: DNA phosphorothioation-associated protein 4, partial [Candidatus Ozemobacteraceae bacterium]|nr:DNA phosphorothioation-associated protein 4 [Candidatus Ozemobacteraceae bacterium]